MTTGMGHANAAASVTALIFSRRFDSPGPISSSPASPGSIPRSGRSARRLGAVPRRLRHRPRGRRAEMPPRLALRLFRIDTRNPDTKPDLAIERRYSSSTRSGAMGARPLARPALSDDDTARGYRRHYAGAGARPPSSCNATPRRRHLLARRPLGERAEQWTRLLTDGTGPTARRRQEDNRATSALAQEAPCQ